MLDKEEIEQAKEHYIFTTKHELDDDNKKLKKYIQHLEQKESILDKLTDTIKKDRDLFNKCRKKHEMYSKSEERLNTKYHYTEKLLNIIEGEKK